MPMDLKITYGLVNIYNINAYEFYIKNLLVN